MRAFSLFVHIVFATSYRCITRASFLRHGCARFPPSRAYHACHPARLSSQDELQLQSNDEPQTTRLRGGGDTGGGGGEGEMREVIIEEGGSGGVGAGAGGGAAADGDGAPGPLIPAPL